MRWMSLSLVCLLCQCTTIEAQTIENFSLTNVADDKPIALEDFKDRPAIVVIFTSTKCAYDGYYLERIKELSANSQRVPVLLINANAEESVEQMKSFISKNALTIPYLADKVLRAFTALQPRKSPECFLLQRKGEKFTVVYRGAIDDNAQTASAVNQSYLKEAIKKITTDQKIETPDVRPVGCSIRTN